ncbi:hypothetical protein PC128_g10276 [Phytophthora cactorum]|nr:hypothetical protein PC120_g12972 [Phytophthora cactorum]KAG3193153.1 hypothetical protein PC128_g10276 [Phytophthora cactorum]KAG4051809.1 hypothetical protein PC123_g12998 [Phytophthora cactorum]
MDVPPTPTAAADSGIALQQNAIANKPLPRSWPRRSGCSVAAVARAP